MKTIIRKKVGAFLLSLTFLISLLPGGSVTAAAACAVDSHTPGSELHAADWNSETGGYAYDYYLCTVCGAACDEDGYSAMLVGPGNGCSGGISVGGKRHVIGDPYGTTCAGTDTAQYYYCKACGHVVDKDGTIVDLTALNGHTPGSTQYPADYAPCTGGCKTSYYRCTVCNLPCDANGDGSVYTPAGPMPHPHTPGSVLHAADWNRKDGGYIRSYYTCTVCDTPCDAKGHAASYAGPSENCPMGLHTPGSEKHEPDYTPCSGGIKEEWYECDVCGAPCDAKGNTLEVLPPIGHTPGSEKHGPNYSPCSGGIKEDWYECETCGQPCDAEGNSIEIHAPTGSHHLVEVPAKDPTYEEDGNSAYWVCSDCQALFKDAEGATPIEDESEIVIPKLDKPNEKPDETPEKPASGTLETVVSDGLAKVPSSVVSQYPTTGNVYEAMIAAALKADPAMDTEKAGSVLLDVTLRIKNANGTITRVTARNFPSEGVEVLLPYPEGTDETFTFVVAHMITTGSRAGEIEILPNTSEKGGIRVRFMSLSPVTITYRASNTPAPGTEDASKPAEAPSDPADPDDSASIDKAPQTGVNNPLFWSFAALLCGGIVLACLVENKKRNR